MDTYYYIYFIENHQKKEIADIALNEKCNVSKELEIIRKTEKNDYIVNIYRFKFFPPKNSKNTENYEIPIKLINSNHDVFWTSLTNININESTFVFDLKFEPKGIFTKKKPPKSLKLTTLEHFNYYNDYCNERMLNKDSLIKATQNNLRKKQEYDLYTYLTIFMECFSPDTMQDHLDLFNLEYLKEKVEPESDINELRLKEIKAYLESLEGDPEQMLKYLKKEKQEENYIKLFSIILYFYQFFKIEPRQNVIDNEKINNYVYKGLIKYNALFKNISLTKEQMQEIFKVITTFNELKIILRYNNNILELLYIIKANINRIRQIYKKDLLQSFLNDGNSAERIVIDFEEYVSPKKDDDLATISELIKNIVNEIICTNKTLFIFFSPSFFMKYINFYNNENLDNLIIIKDLINLVKSNDRNFEMKEDINEYIHSTGKKLCLEGKMTNMQILTFIRNDKYYFPKQNNYKDNTFLDIFYKLDMNKMDENFLKEWNKTDFVDIFGDKYLNFAEIVFSLVKVMEDLHLLLKLLPLRKLPFDIAVALAIKLQNININLYQKSYEKEKCPHINDDYLELIFFADNISNNCDEFLLELENNISPDLIYEIYMRYILGYNFRSNKAENLVVNFILEKNKEKNKIVESHIFILLLERCPKSKEILIKNMKEYQIEENNFFSLTYSENVNLVLGLIMNDYFNSKDILLNNFINDTKNILNKLKEKVENYNITYKEIEHFYTDEQSLEELTKRLLIIYLLDDTKANEKMKLMSERFYKAREIINDLENLINDIKLFFNNNENIDQNKVKELMEKIKKSNLNFCQNNQEILGYSQIIKDAKERIPKKNSLIYMEIYKRVKKLYPYDDCKCLIEANDKLNIFKPYLINENKDNIIGELKDIIKSIKINEEKLNEEINYLLKIFNIENNKYKNILKDSILCIKYREKIIKLLSSIKIIIEKTKIKKEFLSKIINTILSYLQKQEIVKTIQLSINILKNYSIDIFDENDIFNNLLIKLSSSDIELLYDINEEEYEKRRKKNDIDSEEKCKILKLFQDKNSITKLKEKELVTIMKRQLNSNINNKTIISNNDCNDNLMLKC